MTKEELIEKHWADIGIPYNKSYIDDDGFFLWEANSIVPDLIKEAVSLIMYKNYENQLFRYEPHGFIPISLFEIKHNNGWTKCVDENTWPTRRDLWYDVCKFHSEEDNPSEPLKIHRRMTAIEVIHMCNDGIITHWREHKEELKPKY